MSILGCQQQGDYLVLRSCIPKSWPGFEVTFRYRAARYEIVVENPGSVSGGVFVPWLMVLLLPGNLVPLRDYGATHHVQVTLGQSQPIKVD